MPFWQFEFIKLGIVEISTWSFFVSLAFVLGLFLFFQNSRKNNIAISEINFTLKGLGLILTILIVARLFNFFESDWAWADFFNYEVGGVSFFGGLAGGLVYSWLIFYFSSLRQYSFFKLFNLAVIPITVSLIVGRIGCFLVKDHPGTATGLPWGVLWPNGQSRHPVALYLILSYLLLLFLLWFLKNKQKTALFLPVFLLWVGASRFLIDFTRIRDEIFGEKMLGFFSFSQWAAAIVFFIGAYLLFKKSK